MDVVATEYDIDMHGDTVEQKVDIRYFYDEWADFDD